MTEYEQWLEETKKSPFYLDLVRAIARDEAKALSVDAKVEAMIEARDVLRDLKKWEHAMGGWEAPCWARAKRALEKLERELHE